MDEDGIELTGYFRQRRRAGGSSPGRAFLDLYTGRQTAASVLLRPAGGFEAGQPPAARSLSPAKDPPLIAMAVDTRQNAEALLGAALRLADAGLVTLEPVRLLTGEIAPVWLGENADEATRLSVYCGRQDRVYMVPAFETACDLLYRREIAGATVLSGADGTCLGQRQPAPFPRRGTDAPLVITAVGAGERIAMLLPELGGLFRNPLMTVAKVSLCKRDGELISRPHSPAEAEAADAAASMAALARLTVYTSEATRHDGQPVHRVIIRRLRSAGLRGATSVRGIWGFHADHAPHGDRFPRRGHHIPVVTTVTDTPERISAAFDVVDALTQERGLVTAETVLTPHRAAVPHDR